METPTLGHSPGGVLSGARSSGSGGSEGEAGAIERAAFDDVYAANVDFVWRTLRHLGVPATQLDDAVQEAFMVVFRKLSAFEGRSALRTWLYGITVGIARNARRSLRRHGHVESIEPWIESARGPERLAEVAEARDLVTCALDEIDDERREVLVLSDVEELTAVEIAAVLTIPLGTVYSRLRTARREFGEAVARLEEPSVHQGGAR